MSFIKQHSTAIALLAVFLLAGVFFAVRPRVAPQDSFFTVFSLPLKEYSGDTVRLSSVANKPIVAYVWASWCPYCQDGFKELSALQQKYLGVAFVAINRAEPLLDAKGFTDKIGLPPGIRYLLDPDDAFYKLVGGFAMPEYLFVDRKSEIVAHLRGPIPADQLEGQVQALIQ